MIHHPVILGTKVVLLLVLIIVLVILHGVLPPDQFKIALTIGISVFVVSVIALWTVFFIMLNNPNSRLSKSMVLSDASKQSDKEKAREHEKLASLIGTEGIAESNLRLSGIGRFNGTLVDVVSDRLFVDKGDKIIVTGIDGKKLVVKKVE